jgi:hypothetical protein
MLMNVRKVLAAAILTPLPVKTLRVAMNACAKLVTSWLKMELIAMILMNVWKVKLIVSRDVGMTLEAIPATVRLGMSWKAPASVPM